MAKVAKVIVWIGAEVANSNRGVEVAPRVTFRTMEEASAWQDAAPDPQLSFALGEPCKCPQCGAPSRGGRHCAICKWAKGEEP